MRDPKQVTEEEYVDFYKKTFKSTDGPLAWSHFKGDAGSTAFRALIYIPSGVPNEFYSKDYVQLESLKLFVKRVFITNDLGANYLERHLDWIKVFIDVDDLPLNVGRDSLQKTRALAQIKRNLTKRIYDLFGQLAREDPEKFDELYTAAGTALKVGAIDDVKNRDRIVKLLRFESSAVNGTTDLDDVVARRKQGQTQIYYIAGAGAKKAELAQSPFVERILARGYEVLYLTEPVDEMVSRPCLALASARCVMTDALPPTAHQHRPDLWWSPFPGRCQRRRHLWGRGRRREGRRRALDQAVPAARQLPQTSARAVCRQE